MRRMLLAFVAITLLGSGGMPTLPQQVTIPKSMQPYCDPAGSWPDIVGGCWLEFVPRYGTPQRFVLTYLDPHPAFVGYARNLGACEVVTLPLGTPVKRVRFCNDAGCSAFLNPLYKGQHGCAKFTSAGWISQ